MAAFSFWLKSITKYKTGIRSGGYYNNSKQKILLPRYDLDQILGRSFYLDI